MKQLTSPDGQHSLSVPDEQLADFQQRFPDYAVSDVPAPETVYVEDSPRMKLSKDAAFGQEMLNEFLASAKAANLPLNLAEALRAKLEKVHYYLQIGSIGTALEALQAVTPDSLFRADAKAHYISILEDYLA